ncbi:acyltransferase family protein [Arthrobacter sp. MMS18-M83]|uniref:acyltransferase family protein n=1 Tax=Arthrobacter sp. MMS18-M83 TaxID=2996261 RepID=UPI00227C0156|nr:acyltransferase [Arthrobacter sp. MMS18-M83]WAH95919.1 acyltransferase [Arthrobacter sp. MMS18-M83]
MAAVVVLVNHALVVSPAFAGSLRDGTGYDGSPWVWLLTYTPLHVVWGGAEAVYVFFLLSGFVLTLPLLRHGQPSWISYYPKRILRLYLPVWASLIFAFGTTLLVPRIANADQSWWINEHDQPQKFLREAIFPTGGGWLNSPLWSLGWEILFSLLLPLYLYLFFRIQRFWLGGVAGLLVIIGVGSTMGIGALEYLPMFAIGVLMAIRKESLKTFVRTLGGWSWSGLLTIALLLLTSHWTFAPVAGSAVLATAGGAILIFLFLHNGSAIRLGSWGPVKWAGTRSFSLYLVHEPIVVSVAIGCHLTNPALVLVIALPAALLVAEVFFRLVEEPSRKLASRTARLFDKKLRDRTQIKSMV